MYNTKINDNMITAMKGYKQGNEHSKMCVPTGIQVQQKPMSHSLASQPPLTQKARAHGVCALQSSC